MELFLFAVQTKDMAASNSIFCQKWNRIISFCRLSETLIFHHFFGLTTDFEVLFSMMLSTQFQLGTTHIHEKKIVGSFSRSLGNIVRQFHLRFLQLSWVLHAPVPQSQEFNPTAALHCTKTSHHPGLPTILKRLKMPLCLVTRTPVFEVCDQG